jgi:hypothetical protein
MATPKATPEEVCAQVEQEKSELWPDYALAGYVVARLDSEALVPVKAYNTKENARAAAQAQKGAFYYYPLYKEPKTGAKWPSADEVYDYITY